MVAVKRRRLKRDSPENIYRQCQISGNCPPDVKNKIEQNTLADRILKWLSSIIYLGGLGIGTGRGTGGSRGYGPINPGGRVTGTGEVVHPAIPVDPIGPTDIIPVDPNSSSIVPLLEGGPTGDVPDILPGPSGGEVTSGLDFASVDVTTSVETIAEIAPTVDVTVQGAGEDTGATVVRPSTSRGATSTFFNPAYVSSIQPPAIAGEVGGEISGLDVTDLSGFTAATFDRAGLQEEIELMDIVDLEGEGVFDIFEPPSTSTPRNSLQRLIGRARQLYNRRIRQQPVRNPLFIQRPQQLVTFEYENPAFSDPEVTMIFERDVAEVQIPPDFDFLDVARLGRPYLSETADRTVRVSRLGQRSSLQTRQGTVVGERVHYYYDLSPIAAVESSSESIELNTLSAAPIQEGTVDTSIDNSSALLLDVFEEDFSNSRLHIPLYAGTRNYNVLEIPLVNRPSLPLLDDSGIWHLSGAPAGMAVQSSSEGDTTLVTVPFTSVDYYLHPSLVKRRRRRRRPFGDFF
ncbi:L2 protein [Erethizon dorsatum papillomavirus 2]|uniref:Minor capsid protein L2 n=1 Tax=Erethizon dorsatum papillomavirus 2 TaxID=2268125 RepID=A0A2Z5ENG8_9PAPI|nr:L2 protein [Erethizon dorsatum papillomavirus 2]AXB87781.1 L2 protein [Erethizon dorsatum papillomavirus 2]